MPDDEEHVENEEIHTLYISGLPEGVTDREIYLLCRGTKGYVRCLVHRQGLHPIAFAVYEDNAHAMAAKDQLHGVLFDPILKITAQVTLAKSNSKAKRAREDSSNGYDKRNRMVHNSMYSMGAQAGGYPGAPMQAMQYHPLEVGGLASHEMGWSRPTGIPNPPCSTLFVSQLGSRATEEELLAVFQPMAGFKRLRMQNKGPGPVAFVEFEDIPCSSQAMMQMEGAFLASSEGNGVHLEYAKSRMGQPARPRGAMGMQGMPGMVGM